MTKSTLVLNADMQPLSIMPLSTADWKEVIGMIWAGDVSELEFYDDWEVHSPSLTIKVPSVVMLKRYEHIKQTIRYSRERIFLRDRYICQYCGLDMFYDRRKLTIDHVVPKAKGGRSTWINSVTACPSCNFRKSHHDHMKPKHKPYKAEYWDLVNIAKTLPIVVPHESWVPYIGWDEKLIKVAGKE